MPVRLQAIEIKQGEDISLEIGAWQRLYIRVHTDGRCFIVLPLNSGDNIFELRLQGLVKVSEDDYLRSK